MMKNAHSSFIYAVKINSRPINVEAILAVMGNCSVPSGMDEHEIPTVL